MYDFQEKNPIPSQMCQLYAKHTRVCTWIHVRACVFSQLTHVFHMLYFEQLSTCEKKCFTISIACVQAKRKRERNEKKKRKGYGKKSSKRRWASNTHYTQWEVLAICWTNADLLTMLSHVLRMRICANARICICFAPKIAKENYFQYHCHANVSMNNASQRFRLLSSRREKKQQTKYFRHWKETNTKRKTEAKR